MVNEILNNIQSVVKVGQICLAGMLAGLDHVLFRDAAYKGVTRLNELTVSKQKVPIDHLIEGGLLLGILSIAEPFFDQLAGLVVGYLPCPLFINQGLITELDNHLAGEMVSHNSAVHLFYIRHKTPFHKKLHIRNEFRIKN